MNVPALLTMLVLSAAGADQLLADESGKPGAGLEPLFFTGTEQNPDQIRFTLKTQKSQRVDLVVTRRDDARSADLRTTRYNLDLEVQPPEARQELSAPIDKLIQRVRDRESKGPDLRRLRTDSPYAPRTIDGANDGRLKPDKSRDGPFRDVPAARRFAGVELTLCLVLLALALASLPALGGRLAPLLGQGVPGLGGRPLLLLSALAFLLVALVQMFAVPRLLVTVFSGYASVEAAWSMEPVVKYGAATTALYGPILKALGPSTGVVTGTNLVVGLLTLLLVGGVASRLGGHARSAPIAILLVGLFPALMRDRASESVLVPMVWWLSAAWLWADAWLENRRPSELLFAVVHLALALHARPEVWIVAPLWALTLPTLEHRWDRLPQRTLSLLSGGALLMTLAAPRLWSLWHYVGDASKQGGVPGLGGGGDVTGMIDRFGSMNALWMSEIHPLTASLLALLVPLLLPRGRRMATSLVLVTALVWQAVSTADLPPVSIPRVQAPAMIWVATLAAVVLGSMGSRALPVARPAAWMLGLWMLIPSGAALDHLWAPTNAQRFDDWWVRAMEKVETTDQPRCVVALSMADPPRDIVLRHYPIYEIETRSGRLETYGLQTFLEAPGQLMDGHCELLYLQGPQCAARFHGFDQEPPDKAALLPLCQDMHRGFHLTPLHVEDVGNAGNADFPFYGKSETLRYGLYRITRQAMPPP